MNAGVLRFAQDDDEEIRQGLKAKNDEFEGLNDVEFEVLMKG